MNYIRIASFGDLFLVTFIVAASFQIAFSLLGVILAFGLAMNAAISALGALLVLLWRRLLRQGPAALTEP